MKANESVKNYAPTLRQYANYSVRGIKKICTEIGPRPCGSKEERSAQEYFAGDMQSCCDSVQLEEFKVSPHAFMSWVPICITLGVASNILFQFGFAAIGLTLMLLAFFCVVSEFLLYKPALDAIMPKKNSSNVIGIRKCSGEVKRRIIFSGHADSAMEWRFTYYGGPKLLIPITAISFVGMFVSLLTCLAACIAGYAMQPVSGTFFKVLAYVLLGFVPIFLVALLFNNWKRYVHGANDNLTGCFGAISVLKFMQDNNIRFENTEVWALSTGSEETGLRGAKAFCKAHEKELREVETVFVGLETLRDDAHTAIYCRDLTGTVKNSAKACALVKQGAQNAGYDLPYKSVYFGASDSAAVSQAKFHATTLASMDPAPARYYHTRLDTHDNLDAKVIEKGINIALETAFLFDEQGLS